MKKSTKRTAIPLYIGQFFIQGLRMFTRMANLTTGEVRKIRSLYLQSYGVVEIARMTDHSRNTVNEYTGERWRNDVGEEQWGMIELWRKEVRGPIEDFEAQYGMFDSLSWEIAGKQVELDDLDEQIAIKKQSIANLSESENALKRSVAQLTAAEVYARNALANANVRLQDLLRMQTFVGNDIYQGVRYVHQLRIAAKDPSKAAHLPPAWCEECGRIHNPASECDPDVLRTAKLLREEERKLQANINRLMSSIAISVS